MTCEFCDAALDPEDETVVLLRDPWSNDAIGHVHQPCPTLTPGAPHEHH